MLEMIALSKEQVKVERETGNQEITENIIKEIERKMKEEQAKIGESRGNKFYKEI